MENAQESITTTGLTKFTPVRDSAPASRTRKGSNNVPAVYLVEWKGARCLKQFARAQLV